MTGFSNETKQQLINNAKQHIENNQLEQLESTLQKQYTYTEQKSRWVEEIECERYELGEHVVTREEIYGVERKGDYFGSDEKRILLAHAVKHNKVETINWFMEQGYYMTQDQFKWFCSKNSENNPLVETICDKHLTTAINNNRIDYTQTILKNSPHLKNNEELSQRLNVIKPLFSNLQELQTIEDAEKEDNNTQAAQTLRAYASTTHRHIKNFLTGKTSGEAFLDSSTLCACDYMAKLEEKPEGLAIFKNILLCLTVIGPFIKKLDTGQWLYENKTTDKVRSTTDITVGMKASLTLFKSLQEQPESEQNQVQEHLSQPK